MELLVTGIADDWPDARRAFYQVSFHKILTPPHTLSRRALDIFTTSPARSLDAAKFDDYRARQGRHCLLRAFVITIVDFIKQAHIAKRRHGFAGRLLSLIDKPCALVISRRSLISPPTYIYIL